MNYKIPPILWGIFILIVSSFVLVSCNPKPNSITPEFDNMGTRMIIDTVVHDNRRELTKAYEEWVGEEVPDKYTHDGWATWSQPLGSCTIHISKELKNGPLSKYEEVMGHEILHCYYGRYHEKAY